MESRAVDGWETRILHARWQSCVDDTAIGIKYRASGYQEQSPGNSAVFHVGMGARRVGQGIAGDRGNAQASLAEQVTEAVHEVL
jgi:hypothetical protein